MPKYHFDKHRREALVTSKRFALANAAIVAVLAVVGGYYYYKATHASVPPGNSATCTWTAQPSGSVTPGGQIYGSFSFHNTGTTTWSSAYGYDVGEVSGTNWSVNLGNHVSSTPAGSYFNSGFSAYAPGTPGTYSIVFQMGIAYQGQFGGTCSKSVTVAAAAQAPSVPTNLSASAASSSQINLSWSPSSGTGSISYNVYRNGGLVASSIYGTSFPDTGLSPSTTYSYAVSATNGIESARSGGASATTLGTPVSAPGAPSNLSANAVSSTQVSLGWTASGTSGVLYNVYRNGALLDTALPGTTYENTGLSPSTTYSYYVTATKNNIESGRTETKSVTTPSGQTTEGGKGGTVVTPTPTPGSGGATVTPRPATPTPKPASGGFLGFGASTPKATPVPTTPDTSAPSAAGNFTAQLGSDDSTVLLSWDAASDDRGVQGYDLERSKDQKQWDSLATSSGLTLTSYTDTTTMFDTKYYYRITAVDTTGNKGPVATTDITTKAFNANVSSTTDTTVTSSDGLVTALIPAGAVSADASCSLEADSSNATDVGKKLLIGAGPYTLICKDSTGSTLAEFGSAVTISFNPSNKAFSKLSNLKFYSFDSSAWTALVSKTDKKTKLVTATITKPGQIAVLGTTKTGISASLIFIVIFIILLIAGFFIWRTRQQQKSQYAEYIRNKYYNL